MPFAWILRLTEGGQVRIAERGAMVLYWWWKRVRRAPTGPKWMDRLMLLRILVIVLGIAVIVLVCLLILLREKKAERKRKEAHISAISGRMYQSGWIQEMLGLIEAQQAIIAQAVITPGGVDIPGVFQHSFAADTRPFSADEMVVISYIIYAGINDERFMPPRQEADGSFVIEWHPQFADSRREPY